MTLAFIHKITATTVHDASIWAGSCYMDLVNPNPVEIHPHDIARALSRLARFNGLCRGFYSVAEHSLMVFRLARRSKLPVGVQRLALMHDAAEAYLGDVTRPLKAVLPDYQAIEARMNDAIAVRFRLSRASDDWAAVKKLDDEALAIEKRDLLPEAGEWPGLPAIRNPCNIIAVGYRPETVMPDFLRAMQSLDLV